MNVPTQLCTLLPDFPWPDTGGECCYGAAVLGPADCTCWRPAYNVPAQADPKTELDAWPMTKMCGDCAFRAGSPERANDPTVVACADQLQQCVDTATPFWCHNGMRKVTHWTHPSGAVYTPTGSEHAYIPPIIDGRPYKADGTPADYCAGWAARRLKAMGGGR